MSDSKDAIRSRRFSSEKNANNFANKVNSKVQDLRSNTSRKSDFKVSYTKGDANKGMNNPSNDDYDCNGNDCNGHYDDDGDYWAPGNSELDCS